MIECFVKPAALALLLGSVVACERPSVPIPSPDGGGIGAASTNDTPVALPAVVARVNGEPIERWEIESAVKEIELLAVHPVPRSQRDALVRNVTERIIGHHLVAQEARKQQSVSTSDVERDIEQIRKEYPEPGAFEKMLAHFGMSLDQLHQQRRLRLEVAQFIRARIGPITIPEDDVVVYYRENPQQFQEPETLIASHILIATLPTATADEKSAARARAGGILDRLREGAEFGALAREQSQDRESAPAGGRLGPIKKGETDPAFEAAAFATEPGALSGVVETALGYHIIKTHEHRPPRLRALGEVRSDIEELLVQRAQQTRLGAFIEQFKAKATIEIYV